MATAPMETNTPSRLRPSRERAQRAFPQAGRARTIYSGSSPTVPPVAGRLDRDGDPFSRLRASLARKCSETFGIRCLRFAAIDRYVSM
ncbi:hypothetical protein GCM10027447_21050 [Glycomyces halotolerans]